MAEIAMTSPPNEYAENSTTVGLSGPRWWVAMGLVLLATLAINVPTAGDLGLTWDEPAYRYSQLKSGQWWERLGKVRSWSDLQPLLDPNALLFYWPYGRHGINFHPPLAGQLSVATYAIFGGWMKEIPARRMASVLEFSLTVTVAFGFMARRYGVWVGLLTAGSLLFMPRVYGQAHLAETDTPGLMLWVCTTLAFWKGLHEPHTRVWRVLVGVLIGLAFLEKMAAVIVLLPLLIWLGGVRLPRTFFQPGGKADWIDGVITTAALLIPLGITFREILRLKQYLPIPAKADLFWVHPATSLPGAILAVPALIWILRRVLGRVLRKSVVWGTERPALETWTAILAFAPLVGWLGNPAWWRETLPRLTHYYMLSSDRKGALPDIRIIYLGQTYLFSLPWHNAWVLIGVTVPAAILIMGIVGIVYAMRQVRRDRLPLFFLIHFLTLPVLRMLPTPGHDGVRLFLPTFFFLGSFAAWGTVWLANVLSSLTRLSAVAWRSALTALVLGSAAWQLVKIHPYELSYYNELIGGPRGAWHSGFELSYWFDAFNPKTIAELNQKLPDHAEVDFYVDFTEPPTFRELQALGQFRGDIRHSSAKLDDRSFAWLLTQDSKATTLRRLLFVMTPWYANEPKQLDGLRVVTVANSKAIARATALQLLLSGRGDIPLPRAVAPDWVRDYAPWLARFWGQGLDYLPLRSLNEAIFDWAKQDPEGLRASARVVAAGKPLEENDAAQRLLGILARFDDPQAPGGAFSERFLRSQPQALVDAVEILIRHPEALKTVLSRYPYTDPAWIGGYVDRDLDAPAPKSVVK